MGELDVGKEVISAAMRSIPFVGGQMVALMSGAARKRLVERMLDVLREMKYQMDDIRAEQVNTEFFESDEFQTLLALVLQEVQTTHDEKKLKMLAASLCNSGKVEFEAETRKELFIRVLRALSPEHIRVLAALVPCRVTAADFATMERPEGMSFVFQNGKEVVVYDTLAVGPIAPEPTEMPAQEKKSVRNDVFRNGRREAKVYPQFYAPKGERLLLLQGLASHGLVRESLRRNDDDFDKRYNLPKFDLSTRPSLPLRTFTISKFGERFLSFVSPTALDEPLPLSSRVAAMDLGIEDVLSVEEGDDDDEPSGPPPDSN